MSWGPGGCQGWSVPLVCRMSLPLPLFMSHNRQCQDPSAPVDLSRVWKKTWPVRGVNFQYIKNWNCLVQQASLTCRMSPRGQTLDRCKIQGDSSREGTGGGGEPGLWVWACLTAPPILGILPPSPKCVCAHTWIVILLPIESLEFLEFYYLSHKEENTDLGPKRCWKNYCACQDAWERCTINR